MLQQESVDNAVLVLILSLLGKDYLQDFVHVGGTGLALRIGQRKSMHVHLFTSKDLNAEILLEELETDFSFQMDFIDLYFLLADHKYDVERLLSYYQAKYSRRNAMHALKSLNYFDDVDVCDWPEMIKRKDASWDEIQKLLKSLRIIYQED
jgi:hypothetical protein